MIIMPNLYARDIPRDLFKRMKKLQKHFGTNTWTSFFYEVTHRIEQEVEEEKMLEESRRRDEEEEE